MIGTGGYQTLERTGKAPSAWHALGAERKANELLSRLEKNEDAEKTTTASPVVAPPPPTRPLTPPPPPLPPSPHPSSPDERGGCILF
jgi:hypothetical protein